MKNTAHRPTRLRIAGKLALIKHRKSALCSGTAGVDIHRCFEELIQAVCPLNEFEGNADQEEFLQLLNSVASGSGLEYRSRDEASNRGKDIK